jgi:hypothetical protein
MLKRTLVTTLTVMLSTTFCGGDSRANGVQGRLANEPDAYIGSYSAPLTTDRAFRASGGGPGPLADEGGQLPGKPGTSSSDDSGNGR